MGAAPGAAGCSTTDSAPLASHATLKHSAVAAVHLPAPPPATHSVGAPFAPPGAGASARQRSSPAVPLAPILGSSALVALSSAYAGMQSKLRRAAA